MFSSSKLSSVHSRPYLVRQRALLWQWEEPGSVHVQRLWSDWLQTFGRRRGGVHPEAHSRLQVHPDPGSQRWGRFPWRRNTCTDEDTINKAHMVNRYVHTHMLSHTCESDWDHWINVVVTSQYDSTAHRRPEQMKPFLASEKETLIKFHRSE